VVQAGNRNGWLLAALLAFALLPYAVASVPDAADYPNHLARHHVLAMAGLADNLNRDFIVAWRWIGNLGVDLPVLLLTPLLGVELATRAVAALIAPVMVIGILMLSRAAHGRVTASAALALPFAFALPFLYGFLNFCLSVALALIVAALWFKADRRSAWSAAGFAAAAVLVWTAHIMGWLILLTLIAGAELASLRTVRELPGRALRAAPLLLPVLPLLLWRSKGAAALFWYAPHLLEQKAMNFVTVLKGVWLPLDLAMTAAVGIGALLALVWAGGRKLEPRLAMGGALLVLATLLGPSTALGSWGADLRLAPYAVMVCVMAIGPAADARREKLLLALGASLFVLRSAWISAQWHAASRQYEARLAILDGVPRHARLGFLVMADRCRTPWTMKADRKLGAYAIVRRDAFSNTLFQIPGADIMILRDPAARVTWTDGSQEIARLCPQGAPDMAELGRRMARMKQAGFDHLWVAGLPAAAIPAGVGYRIERTLGTDTLLVTSP